MKKLPPPGPIRLITDQRDVARARVVLKRIEREIAADWAYHDYDREAVDDIKALAKALRAVIGPDLKEQT